MSRRWSLLWKTLLTAAVIVIAVMGRPAIHLARVWWNDDATFPAPAAGTTDDASRLNQTRVAAVIDISPDDAIAVQQIRDAFERARREKRSVSVAAVRHSMGGQTIAGDGIVLNMLAHDHTYYSMKTGKCVVGAGATWDLVIPYLDRFGVAVEVMQSDSAFSVGGSISVNAHGWQPNRPPIAATVEAISIVTPDGVLRRCSRTENAELFAHALGGYGLFGVILDVQLKTVPNEKYRRRATVMAVSEFETAYDRQVLQRSDVGLAYGRVSVSPDSFLREAVLTRFTRVSGTPPPLHWYEVSELERLIFRGSVRSDYGKRLRWWSERHLAPLIYRSTTTRNDLMDGDIGQYINRDPADRDILHEYFVPRGKLMPFLESARRVIPKYEGELLNVTIRDVRRDDLTALRYARDDMFAVVLFFAQRPVAAEEKAMTDMTRELIDSVLALGGTYYLPYRLHATPAQFRSAYPEADAFFATKLKYDPDELLQNSMYRKYRIH